jgi:hypothetical protein
MSRTERRPSRRSASHDGDATWVIDLTTAEARRAVQPVASGGRRHRVTWLLSIAALVWVYDLGSLVVHVRR